MKTLFTLAALAAAAITTPALARPADRPETVKVSYADLDLGTSAGVRSLDRRIGRAAEWACGPVSDLDLAGQNDARACRADVVAKLGPVRTAAIAGVAGVRVAQNR